MHSRSWLRRSGACVALAAFAFSASAQDGSYDTTFGDGGKVWVQVPPSSSNFGNKMVRLPNGDYFIAGACGSTPCAIWLTSSGALATGYGTSGTGTAMFSSYLGWPSNAYTIADAAALPDGRVAVLAQNGGGSGAYLAALLANGTGLDPSIGNGAGYVSVSLCTPYLLRVTTQQQFITAGQTQFHTGIEVARYDSIFRLDTTFGNNGTTSIGFADGAGSPRGMTLQRDGKIVVIGSVSGTPPALAIVRLTSTGAQDPDFGIDSDGVFESTLNNTYGAVGNDIVEDKKGRLVFAGYANTDSSGDGEWLVDRLLSGGATDPTFNSGHPRQFTILSSSTTGTPSACCVAFQSDNRIVVAASMDRPSSGVTYFAITRFMDDGSFDSSFGGGGQSYGDMSPESPDAYWDMPKSMAIVPGGIVVAGTTEAKLGTGFSAAKEQIDLLFADDFE